MLVNIAHFQRFGIFPARTIRSVPQRLAQKIRAAVSRPSGAWRIRSTFDDVHDLVGVRTKNDVPAVHEDELVPTPFRIDFHDA